MFQYPVTEIYSATGERVCVFSAEEHAAKLADGWLEERPAPFKWRSIPTDTAANAIKEAMSIYDAALGTAPKRRKK